MTETMSYADAAAVTPHGAASSAARDVLIEGGNAIEAAVAALAVVSAVLPQTGGAGGDGLWLIREPGPRGRTRVLDARGPIADAATLRHFSERDLDRIPESGADSVLAVPGSVAGWRAALDFSRVLGGTMPVRRLLENAVALARDGFAAPDPTFAAWRPDLAVLPGLVETFLVDGALPQAGTLRRAPKWAETLGYLAQAGLDDFYRGDVGREIVQDLRATGSLLGREDLRHFEPRWREPSSMRGGLGLMEAPANRVALHLLAGIGLFERLTASRSGSVAHAHGSVEAVRRAHRMLDDADETDDEAVSLLEPWRLALEADGIDSRRAASVAPRRFRSEACVLLCVIDGRGLAVALVQSLGLPFGSGCLLPRTSLLMGNRGAGFDLDDDHGLALRRGRRAPMAALPLIVTGRDGGVTSLAASSAWPAVGVLAHLVSGASLTQAIDAPRLDPSQPVVRAEDTHDPSDLTGLGRVGHDIEIVTPLRVGEIAALCRSVRGRVEAAPDPRRGGSAEGI